MFLKFLKWSFSGQFIRFKYDDGLNFESLLTDSEKEIMIVARDVF